MPKISVDEYVAEAKAELDKFVMAWKSLSETQPEKHPHELQVEGWRGEELAYRFWIS